MKPAIRAALRALKSNFPKRKTPPPTGVRYRLNVTGTQGAGGSTPPSLARNGEG